MKRQREHRTNAVRGAATTTTLTCHARTTTGQVAAAVSFLVVPASTARLSVHVTGGRYRPLQVIVRGTEPAADVEPVTDSVRTWWIRSDVRITAEFDPAQLAAPSPRSVLPNNEVADNADGLELQLRAFTRPRSDGSALVTVALVNRCAATSTGADKNSLFQLAMEGLSCQPRRDGSDPALPVC